MERASLRDVGEFSGSLIPSAQFVVSAKIGGRLEKLTVDVGDTVRKGELIADLEDEEAVQQVEQAKAELMAAEAKNTVSNAQIRQKEAALKAAEIHLSYTKIRADWNRGDGTRVIGERFADEGALLGAGDPIVSVLDIDTLEAAINVIERDYPRIREGQPRPGRARRGPRSSGFCSCSSSPARPSTFSRGWGAIARRDRGQQ